MPRLLSGLRNGVADGCGSVDVVVFGRLARAKNDVQRSFRF